MVWNCSRLRIWSFIYMPYLVLIYRQVQQRERLVHMSSRGYARAPRHPGVRPEPRRTYEPAAAVAEPLGRRLPMRHPQSWPRGWLLPCCWPAAAGHKQSLWSRAEKNCFSEKQEERQPAVTFLSSNKACEEASSRGRRPNKARPAEDRFTNERYFTPKRAKKG